MDEDACIMIQTIVEILWTCASVRRGSGLFVSGDYGLRHVVNQINNNAFLQTMRNPLLAFDFHWPPRRDWRSLCSSRLYYNGQRDTTKHSLLHLSLHQSSPCQLNLFFSNILQPGGPALVHQSLDISSPSRTSQQFALDDGSWRTYQLPRPSSLLD